MCKVPAFLDGGHGAIQCYLIPGDTRMRIGRPIMDTPYLPGLCGEKRRMASAAPVRVCGSC